MAQTFSGRPLIILELVITSNTPNAGANNTTIGWTLQARETASQPSFGLDPIRTASVNFTVSGGGTITSTSYAFGTNIPWAYDFRPTGLQTMIIGSGSFVVTHNTAGTGGTVSASSVAADAGGGLLGSADHSFAFGLNDFVRLPSTPAAPTLSRSNNGATLTITGATATFFGSSPSYQYRVSRDGGSTWYTSGTLGSGRVSSIGVTNTDALRAQTRAVDSEGTGSYSASSASSAGVPLAPGAAPTLTRTADGTSITLTSATATGAVSYDYRQSLNGSTWGLKVDIASGRTVTITGLTYDQIYYYQTRASNATGDGEWSATASIAGAPPSFSGSGTDTTIASPAIWGVSYTDGVTALRARSYSVVANTLPTGLNLNTGTGAITGTPTSTTTFSFPFTITATNNAGTATTSATIAIISPVRVTHASGTTPSFRTGQVRINTTAGTTPNFNKTGIVRVWNGSTWKPTTIS